MPSAIGLAESLDIALPSLSPEKKHIMLATQDFQAKDMIFPIMLENKAPNPIAASCLKIA
jgi:hypothetical protein